MPRPRPRPLAVHPGRCAMTAPTVTLADDDGHTSALYPVDGSTSGHVARLDGSYGQLLTAADLIGLGFACLLRAYESQGHALIWPVVLDDADGGPVVRRLLLEPGKGRPGYRELCVRTEIGNFDTA